MKITFVMPYPILKGGIRVIVRHAEELKALGHEVRLVCTGRRPRPWRARIKMLLQGKGWQPYITPSEIAFESPKIPYTLLDRYRPVVDADIPDGDVVVATWWETAPWVAALAPSKGAKVYYMQDYGEGGQAIGDILLTWELPLHIVTISERLANMVRQHVDIEVGLVPNAVDLENFSVPRRPRPSPPTVGFLYTHERQKGTDVCIEAANLARKRILGLRIVSFGSRPPLDHMPLPGGTDFHVRIPDEELKNIYGACTAWLFGSRNEGFGLPILEAMASRTPVIATPAGAAEQLVTPERGRLVPQEDPGAMADAIVEFCEMDEDRWGAMSDACRDFVAGYTWRDAARLFERVLVRAIEKTRLDIPR